MMNRKILLQAVERIATEAGYHFHSTSDEQMSQLITSYPAVWLSPPIFNTMQGRKHGKITYAVTLHALDAGSKLAPEKREQVWAKLEEDVVGMFSTLSQQDFVVAVENLKIRHTSHTLTSHGEVAATATADVITFF